MNRLFFAVAILLLGLAAVRSTAAETGSSDAAVQKVADPILDDILRARAEGNFEAYTRLFDATVRKAVDENGFRRSLKVVKALFGQYQSRTYLGFYKKQKMTVVLWKARFSGTEDDVLVKLVLSGGQKVTVAGVWFQ